MHALGSVEAAPCGSTFPAGAFGRAMSEPPRDEHGALICAIAERGDRAAFAALFAHFAPRLKAHLIRLGSRADAAEELAQETLLTVWRKAALYDPARAGAAAWIFAIARNLRIDAARHARLPLPEPDPADTPEAPPGADALVAAAERARRVLAALDSLPREQAEVVRLAFFDDRPHAQIEQALGIPLGTVKSRLRLAMARLRTLVGDGA